MGKERISNKRRLNEIFYGGAVADSDEGHMEGSIGDFGVSELKDEIASVIEVLNKGTEWEEEDLLDEDLDDIIFDVILVSEDGRRNIQQAINSSVGSEKEHNLLRKISRGLNHVAADADREAVTTSALYGVDEVDKLHLLMFYYEQAKRLVNMTKLLAGVYGTLSDEQVDFIEEQMDNMFSGMGWMEAH